MHLQATLSASMPDANSFASRATEHRVSKSDEVAVAIRGRYSNQQVNIAQDAGKENRSESETNKQPQSEQHTKAIDDSVGTFDMSTVSPLAKICVLRYCVKCVAE